MYRFSNDLDFLGLLVQMVKPILWGRIGYASESNYSVRVRKRTVSYKHATSWSNFCGAMLVVDSLSWTSTENTAIFPPCGTPRVSSRVGDLVAITDRDFLVCWIMRLATEEQKKFLAIWMNGTWGTYST